MYNSTYFAIFCTTSTHTLDVERKNKTQNERIAIKKTAPSCHFETNKLIDCNGMIYEYYEKE